MVGGVWRMTRAGRAATLVVQPLERLPSPCEAAVAEEAARLLAFLAVDAEDREVRVGSAA
jgi:hypothetical protein